uniref:Peptidase A1 domain-containing protein n=1 Tax=Ditylenchus dipsaci TaxID=166011 RepID=A0A915DDV4_9BILA
MAKDQISSDQIAKDQIIRQFTAHQVQLSPKASIAKKHRIESFLKQHNPHAFAGMQRMERGFEQKFSKLGSSFVDLTETYHAWVGNISVGTPPQNFTVEFDPFYAVDLELIDSKAVLTDYQTDGVKRTYDTNVSSSYVKKGGYFSDHEINGYIGSDIVNISELSTKMTFGILNDNIESLYEDESTDGLFGLHLFPSENRITSAVEQFVGKLDKPVVTVFMNKRHANGLAQLTLGSENEIYCENNSDYVPLLPMNKNHNYGYQFHLNTAAATVNGVEVSVKMNTTVFLYPYAGYNYCDKTFESILIVATGAIYNSTTEHYHVDCGLKSSAQVTLNIGDKDHTTLVLTGADYLKYDDDYDTCYLGVAVDPSYNGELYLGHEFFNNHCFSYNVNDKTIAFSDAKNI